MTAGKTETKTELLKRVAQAESRCRELEARLAATLASPSSAADARNRELELRSRIAQVLLGSDEEQVYHDLLNVLLELFDSPYGVFGYIDDNGAFVVPSMTRHIWSECQVADKRFVFPRDTWGDSTWPTAIRERRLIYSNAPSTVTPQGHIRITRHISSPIIFDGDVIGLFQVANRGTDYGKHDLELCDIVSDALAPVLSARLERDREELSRRAAQEDVRKLNEQLEEQVAQLAQSVLELSTPTIQLWDEIVLLPLIGVLDTARAHQLTEGVLRAVGATGATVAIIDVTGVPVVDTSVALHLVRTVSALKMLGCDALVTGLSPETAQALVRLGTNLLDFRSCGSLRSGLAEAFRIIGIRPTESDRA